MKYHYSAVIKAVYDGDTVTADIDLGLRVTKREKLRLARINAPEVRGDERPQGLESRDWLRARLLDREVEIKTKKDRTGKYGRYVAEIYEGGECINDLLVLKGMAEYQEYTR